MHHSEGICCAIKFQPDIEKMHDPPVPVLPPSRWCKYCRKFSDTAIDYQSALFERRSAKTRMKNAYREMQALE